MSCVDEDLFDGFPFHLNTYFDSSSGSLIFVFMSIYDLILVRLYGYLYGQHGSLLGND